MAKDSKFKHLHLRVETEEGVHILSSEWTKEESQSVKWKDILIVNAICACMSETYIMLQQRTYGGLIPEYWAKMCNESTLTIFDSLRFKSELAFERVDPTVAHYNSRTVAFQVQPSSDPRVIAINSGDILEEI